MSLFRKEDVAYVDSLVQEYLAWRGFVRSAATFKAEQRSDKSRGYNAGAVVERLVELVKSYELEELLSEWAYLGNAFFSRLQSHASYSSTVERLELSLQRFYVVNALQQGRVDAASHFFASLGHQLASAEEWRGWFALPFLPEPQHSAEFAVFFTPKWKDNLLVSLQNFLATIFASVPPPRILNFASEQETQRELRSKIAQLQLLTSGVTVAARPDTPPPPQAAARVFSSEPAALKSSWRMHQEVFSGHTSPVTRLRWSCSGDVVASASLDGMVRVWSHEPSKSPNGNALTSSAVRSLEWNCSDRYLFVGGSDAKVRLWDIESHELVGEVHTLQNVDAVRSSPVDPNLFVTASNAASTQKGALQHWSLSSLTKPLRNFLLDTDAGITCAAYNHNGSLLVAGGSDGCLRIVDFSIYAPILAWNATLPGRSIRSVRLSPDDNSVWAVDNEGTATLWSMHKPGVSHYQIKASGGASSSHNVTLDPTGQNVALGRGNETHIYSVAERKMVQRIEGHTGPVSYVAWHPSEDVLVTASEDTTCRIVKLAK